MAGLSQLYEMCRKLEMTAQYFRFVIVYLMRQHLTPVWFNANLRLKAEFWSFYLCGRLAEPSTVFSFEPLSILLLFTLAP